MGERKNKLHEKSKNSGEKSIILRDPMVLGLIAAILIMLFMYADDVIPYIQMRLALNTIGDKAAPFLNEDGTVDYDQVPALVAAIAEDAIIANNASQQLDDAATLDIPGIRKLFYLAFNPLFDWDNMLGLASPVKDAYDSDIEIVASVAQRDYTEEEMLRAAGYALGEFGWRLDMFKAHLTNYEFRLVIFFLLLILGNSRAIVMIKYLHNKFKSRTSISLNSREVNQSIFVGDSHRESNAIPLIPEEELEMYVDGKLEYEELSQEAQVLLIQHGLLSSKSES